MNCKVCLGPKNSWYLQKEVVSTSELQTCFPISLTGVIATLVVQVRIVKTYSYFKRIETLRSLLFIT